jgi:hypothetical protein
VNHISKLLRSQVIDRAGNRCEYCGLDQNSQEATFHVDHVVPKSANGPTALSNLALSCVSCSLRKGSRQSVIDPETGNDVSLFNPPLEQWEVHFELGGDHLRGITATGRATVVGLNMNRPTVVAIRRELAILRHDK